MNKTIINDEQLYNRSYSRDFQLEKVQWQKIIDQKNGNYTDNSLIYEVNNVNATYYTNLGQCYIHLAQKVVMTGLKYEDLANENSNDFALSYKASVMDCLHQVQIWLNDKQVNTAQSNSNIPANWNLMKMSQSDYAKLSDLINYTKPACNIKKATANCKYAPAGFEYNNVLIETFDTKGGFSKLEDHTNTEFFARFKKCMNFGDTGISTYVTNTTADASGVNTLSKSGTAGQKASGVNTYIFHNFIPLALIHPFFAKIVPLRGFKLRLQILANLEMAFKLTATATGTGYTGCSFTKTGINGVCPLLVSPAVVDPAAGSFGTAEGVILNADGDVTVSMTVATNTSLWVNQLFFSPDYEISGPDEIKTILYEDYYVLPSVAGLSSIAQGSSVASVLLHQSVLRPRGLLLIPYDSVSMNNPFSCQPFQCLPYGKLTNINIAINGINIFQTPLQYSYSQFLEFASGVSSDGLNVKDFGLTNNGFITKSQWEQGYGMYFFDLTQFVKHIDDDNLAKQIHVSFTNSYNMSINVWAVIFKENQIDVQQATGQIDVKVV